MSTTNLKLEEIVLDDTISGTMLEKLNSNIQKIDNKYGELKNTILEKTGKTNLNDAVRYIQELSDEIEILNEYINETKTVGTASSSDILNGKTAIVQGEIITGNIQGLEAQTIIPNTKDQTIDAGQYLNGIQTIKGDANLIASNIVSGRSIFGINGTAKSQATINVSLTGTYASQVSGYGAGINQNGVLVIWAMTNTNAYENVSFLVNGIIGTAGNGWNITNFDTSNYSGVPFACTISGLSNYSILNITLNATNRDLTYDYTQIAVTVTGS